MADGPRFRSAAIGEMQTSIVASYMGKCHVIDSLMWLRSFENKNIWWKDGSQPIAKWLYEPTNFLEHNRFSAAVLAALELNVVDNSRMALKALEVYVSGVACKGNQVFCIN